MRVCVACKKPNSPDVKFCGWCGVPLGLAASGRELRKTVTVLVCDLVDSTGLGERLDSETLRRVMAKYYEELVRVLERCGNPTHHFAGDAAIAFFGVPTVAEDDALRAVRAAVGMRCAIGALKGELHRRWGIGVEVRIGVNTGEVVAREGAEGFVVGDAVNVAARLEQAAPTGEILIGPETYRLVRDAVSAEPVEPLILKGKSAAVAAFRLLDVVEQGAEVRRPLDVPFVGREQERSALARAFRRSVEESGCVLTVLLGAAGVGKSRLAREVLNTLGADVRVLTGRCLPYGEGITFWPVAQVVKAAAGIEEADLPEAAVTKLTRVVSEAADTQTIVDRLAGAIGLSSFESAPQEISWAVRSLLEALAAERPLVVVVEDIHWAEPTLLDLVEYVARTSRERSIWLLCLTRPEFLSERLSAQVIGLEPLGDGESRLLVERLLDAAGLADNVWEPVAAAAEGNPLFLAELVRVLVDEGLLERQVDRRWRAAAAFSAFSIPSSIQALLAARLERLTSRERVLIERASIIGQEFWPSAIYELAPEFEPFEVDRHLAALVRKQLVRAGGVQFAGEAALRFTHGLIRDVAYGATLKEARAELHERFATWLVAVAGERAAEYEEILGYHLEQAYRCREALATLDEHARRLARDAAQRIGSAGRRALARGDMPAAVNLLERAISLLPPDDPSRGDLTLKLGIALAETGDLERADALLSQRLGEQRRGRHYLAYVDDSGHQRPFDLDPASSPITIGRKSANDLALAWDSQVSRRHAELQWVVDHWVVIDQPTSRNGSFVNGQRIAEARPLADGDVLRVGNTFILYRKPVARTGRHHADESASTTTRAQF